MGVIHINHAITFLLLFPINNRHTKVVIRGLKFAKYKKIKFDYPLILKLY